MRTDKALKRVAAVLLSLSMAIAPVHPVGLSMTAYAAEDGSDRTADGDTARTQDEKTAVPAGAASQRGVTSAPAEDANQGEATREEPGQMDVAQEDASTEGGESEQNELPQEGATSAEGESAQADAAQEDASTEGGESEQNETPQKGATSAEGESDQAQPEVTAAPTEATSQPEVTAAPTEETSQPEATAAPTEATSQPEVTAAPTEATSQVEVTTAPTETSSQADTTRTETSQSESAQAGTTQAEATQTETTAAESPSARIQPGQTAAPTEETAAAQGETAASAAKKTASAAGETVKGNSAQPDLQTQQKERKANPFGLDDKAMPSEPSDAAGSSSYNVLVKTGDVNYEKSFTIKYTVEDGTQRTFKVTSDMNPSVKVLHEDYEVSDSDTGTVFKGFKVSTMAITVTDKKGGSLTFYADDIVGRNFYVRVIMELASGDRFTDDLFYNETPEETGSQWDRFEEATLKAGRYTIDVSKPYGVYAALTEINYKASDTGKALLIAVDGDETLGHTPVEDIEAVKAALVRTNQFEESDITVIVVPADTSGDKVSDSYKSRIWKWIDKTAAAGNNDYSFIAYSGHGNFHNDGTSELSIGGDNTISAVDLKAHVSKLHGKVVMLFDCCYSGGMIMPTMIDGGDDLLDGDMAADGDMSYDVMPDDGALDGSEEYTDGMGEDAESAYMDYYMEKMAQQAQQYADESMKAFVDEFRAADGSAESADSPDYATDDEISHAYDNDSDDETGRAFGYDQEKDIDIAGLDYEEDDEVMLGSALSGAYLSKSSSSESSGSELSYYIYTVASAYETGIQSNSLGGQIVGIFEHALGYDRNKGGYNIFAADTNGDEKVSAEELSRYMISSAVASEPTVYYPAAGGDDTLFTYDHNTGIPAILSAETAEQTNVIMDPSTRSVTVEVNVTNYSKKDISIDAAAITVYNTYENCPGAVDPDSYSKEGRKKIFTGETNGWKISSGTHTVKFTFRDITGKYFKEGGRFLIKIWCTDEGDGANAFAMTDFYVGKSRTAKAVDADGKAAWAIKRPAQVCFAFEAPEVSSIVPLDVVFDTEPTTKSGYAALTLTARAYDLGTSDGRTYGAGGAAGSYGYSIGSGGGIELNDQAVRESRFTCTDIYTDVRPTYVRNDEYKLGTAGSTYSFMWDVSGLTKGHYYAVQVVCAYDDGTSQKMTTFIKTVDKATADRSKVVIGSSFIDMSYFASNYMGIKLGDVWKEYGANVEKVTEAYVRYLNKRSYKTGSDGSADIHYSIADGTSTGWYVLDADNTLTEMAAGDTFKTGKSYVSRINMTIDDSYNAEFSSLTSFEVSGHMLYNKAPYKSQVNFDNQKQATIYVIHKNIPIKESYLKVCRGESKEVLEESDVIRVGDYIDVYVQKGYEIKTKSLYSCLKEVKSTSQYTRYEVVEEYDDEKKLRTELQLIICKEGSGAADEDCCCGTVFYTHAISDSPIPEPGGGDDGSDSGDDSGYSSDSSRAADDHDYETASGMWQAENAGQRTGAAGAAGTGTSIRYRFMLDNGDYATGWQYISCKGVNSWYLFDSDGYMRTGWVKDKGSWYCLGADGTMTAGGWVKDRDAWYYLGSNGKMVTGSWTKYQGDWYYLGTDGKMAKGWIKDQNAWYYLDGDGRMCVGWVMDQNIWYYLDKQGRMMTGYQTIDGMKQHFGQDGALIDWAAD